MSKKELDPGIKRRNRILALVLVLIIIFIVLFTASGIYDSDFSKNNIPRGNQSEHSGE